MQSESAESRSVYASRAPSRKVQGFTAAARHSSVIRFDGLATAMTVASCK